MLQRKYIFKKGKVLSKSKDQTYLGCGAGNEFGSGKSLVVDTARLAGLVNKAIRRPNNLRCVQSLTKQKQTRVLTEDMY